jgi:hypothetical protein
VRFAASAARHAARAPRGAHPRQVARAAIMAAARRHAPGLLRKTGGRRPGAPRAGARYYGAAAAAYPTADGDGYSFYDPDAGDDDDSGEDQGLNGDGDIYGDADSDGMVPAGSRRRGSWVRRGRRIILYGV